MNTTEGAGLGAAIGAACVYLLNWVWRKASRNAESLTERKARSLFMLKGEAYTRDEADERFTECGICEARHRAIIQHLGQVDATIEREAHLTRAMIGRLLGGGDRA